MRPDTDSRWGIQVALGLILTIVGRVVFSLVDSVDGPMKWLLIVPGTILVGMGVVFWYWGCGTYAMRKGYSAVLAALGLFGPIGIVIIAMLPDRSAASAEQVPDKVSEDSETISKAA